MFTKVTIVNLPKTDNDKMTCITVDNREGKIEEREI